MPVAYILMTVPFLIALSFDSLTVLESSIVAPAEIVNVLVSPVYFNSSFGVLDSGNSAFPPPPFPPLFPSPSFGSNKASLGAVSVAESPAPNYPDICACLSSSSLFPS